jgi:hypothetical protein
LAEIVFWIQQKKERIVRKFLNEGGKGRDLEKGVKNGNYLH